jgi:hypothetical protein
MVVQEYVYEWGVAKTMIVIATPPHGRKVPKSPGSQFPGFPSSRPLIFSSSSAETWEDDIF